MKPLLITHLSMNWNADYMPGLLTRHQCLVSNAFVVEWACPDSHIQQPSEKPSQKTGGYYNSKVGLNLG